MGKVLLIDGNNLVHRYHDVYADAKGPVCYTGGLFGLIAGVRKFLSQNSDHDAVVFVVDKGVPKWRFEVCPEYKQQRRDKTPEEQVHYDRYKEQVRHTRHVVRHTGCAFASAKGFEGDDVIAALALRVLKHEQITVYSSDRDYIELIDESRVNLYSPIKHIWEDRNPYYSIERCLDPKVSDNLDGVPGVGEVAAAAAVQLWQHDGTGTRAPDAPNPFPHSTAKALEDFLLWCEMRAPLGLTEKQVKAIPDRTDRAAMKAAIAAMSKDERTACKAAAKIVPMADKVRANYECSSLRWAAKLCEPHVELAVEPPDREAYIEMVRTYRIAPLIEDLSASWPIFTRLDNARLAPALTGSERG